MRSTRASLPLLLVLTLTAASAAPAVSYANCDAVSADEVAAILGFAVQPADEAARSGGTCFYTTRALTDDGNAGYTIVTAADLARRRTLFAVLARRCGDVSGASPEAGACAVYAKLADAMDLAAYYDAWSGTDATPVPRLDTAAFATASALYVRRPSAVFEVVVKRGDTLDLPRSIALASLLLARLPP